ncbi:MAG: D-mycarose [Rhodospirillaceae bacterium]|nr:MAG: D-mycarose [Rhodospirillaceae bacterium]TNC97443.1 MAG: D-mycarose 3-C-methyltransferase [Stygiobacter sp.]
MSHACRLCRGHDLSLVIDLGSLPIAHRLLERRDQTEEVFPFQVHVCQSCGLIQIVDPVDPGILYDRYNYNFSSWKPEPHLPDELDLICAGGAPGAVAEIGCNDGRFLSELQQRGVALRVGIEPNPVSGSIARDRGHHVHQGMLGPDLVTDIVHAHGQFDVVVSRQVFEHLLDIDNFFACAAKLLKADGFLFVDLPDFQPSFDNGDVSVLWEEHVSYFTEPVLLAAFARNGFLVETVRKYDFSGGTIAVKARRAEAPAMANSDVTAIVHTAQGFAARSADYAAHLRTSLEARRAQGARVVLYGVGCRACTVVNALDLKDCIDFAVDDQPERQGMFMPGSRLEIKPSAVLADDRRPLVCLLAVNNESEDKVMQKVMNLSPDRTICVTLFSPKDIHQALAALDTWQP